MDLSVLQENGMCMQRQYRVRNLPHLTEITFGIQQSTKTTLARLTLMNSGGVTTRSLTANDGCFAWLRELDFVALDSNDVHVITVSLERLGFINADHPRLPQATAHAGRTMH
jgi:hypothetical protein